MSTSPVDSVAAFRFGFGLPLPQGAPTDPRAMMAMLTGPDPVQVDYPTLKLADVVAATRDAHKARAAARNDQSRMAEDKAATKVVEALAEAGFRAQIARALDSPDGLRERLVRFWADHLTVAHKNRLDAAVVASYVDDAFRPHVAGRFDRMPTTDVRAWAALAMQGLYGLDRGLLQNAVFPGLDLDWTGGPVDGLIL